MDESIIEKLNYFSKQIISDLRKRAYIDEPIIIKSMIVLIRDLTYLKVDRWMNL